jgi:hypothetical protein
LSCSRVFCKHHSQARLTNGIVWEQTVLIAFIVHAHDLSALPDDLLEERLTVAQREAMEARAEYEIRNKITHNVLVMDPVLGAVHGGEQTSFADK